MKRNIGAILFSVILISVITFPFLWLLLGSFKTMKELFSVPIRFFPEHISLDNYIAVFKAQPFGLYLYNSFVIALLGTVLVVVASAIAPSVLIVNSLSCKFLANASKKHWKTCNASSDCRKNAYFLSRGENFSKRASACSRSPF